MPLIHAGSLQQYYRIDGNENRPVLMFSHSLGCDHSQWDPQSCDLEDRFCIVRYDLRGHGATGVPAGDYNIEMLARDALSLADALGIERFAFCGLSLGGMIGQWLGARAPQRLSHLVLANTSSHFADPAPMETRRKTVLDQGIAAIQDSVMRRFFMPETLAANPPSVARIHRVLLATDPKGYAASCAAVRDMDQTSLLSSIHVPVLIIAGDRDVSTPWQGHGDVLAREIPEATSEHLRTAHLSNLESPQAFTAVLLRFLSAPPVAAL